MICRCNDLRNNLNNREKFEKIIAELTKLKENSSSMHQSVSNFSSACSLTFFGGDNLGLDSMKKSFGDDFLNKIETMIKECNDKIELLDIQYKKLQNEDELYHKQLQTQNK